MRPRETISVSANDVWDQFSWKIRPVCRCGEIARAVEAKLVFVSPQVVENDRGATNVFYMLPVGGDGFFALDEGITIDCCPWCGDQIVGTRS